MLNAVTVQWETYVKQVKEDRQPRQAVKSPPVTKTRVLPDEVHPTAGHGRVTVPEATSVCSEHFSKPHGGSSQRWSGRGTDVERGCRPSETFWKLTPKG